MQLTLQADDVALLTRILTLYLSDLRMEITDTENFEWRQSMKGDEERVKAWLGQLEAPGSAGTTGANRG